MKYEHLLKEYMCITPFVYMELHKNGIYSCCPSWLDTKVGELSEIETVWKSETLKNIHDSILDDSYRYCSKSKCPYLSQILNEGTIPSGFSKKSDFKFELHKDGPTNINFAFDRSCNLSCPTCRNVVMMADGTELEFVENTMNDVINTFGKNIKYIYLSGSADPFASKTFRKFLLNFDKTKFPNLKQIHIHTNGLLFTEKMWNNLSNVHEYIKSFEISIDAANKETYEIVRRGGNWDVLIENLKFIGTLKIKSKRVSFVVQDSNYLEMEDFYNLMMGIFNNKVDVFFGKISNWGTYSESEFKIKNICDESHPEFNMFLHNLNKINSKYKCLHNMHDIIDKHLPKKRNGLI